MTDGAEGEVPPEYIKEIMDMYRATMSTNSPEERHALWTEIARRQAENLWAIGTVGLTPKPIVISQDLRNVPEQGIWAWDYFFGVIASPEQFYLDR
jgi:peptide/nickel transport system substrate-binding protein